MSSLAYTPPSGSGRWSEDEYLALQNRTNGLIELSDGRIEAHSIATPFHQRIVASLLLSLYACVKAANAGEVLQASLPIRLWAGKYRDPDVSYFKPGRITNPHRQPDGADLAIEVVSDGEEDRRRDLQTKRREYAEAGIAEYWIVDPQTETITVLVLDGTEYRVHGEFRIGETATSVLLSNFVVDVKATFAAGQG